MSVPFLGQESYLIVVKRDEGPLFLLLQHLVESLGHVDVIWDRRRGERRANPGSVQLDRRARDRRQTAVVGPVLAHLVKHASAA